MHKYAQVCAISYLHTILRYKASSTQTQAQLGHATPRQGKTLWTDRHCLACICISISLKISIITVLVVIVDPGVCMIVVAVPISSVLAPHCQICMIAVTTQIISVIAPH